MVRLKHRYLLVNILYPSPPHDAKLNSKAPPLLSLYAPTTPALSPQLLLKAIRAGVVDLFGDYGGGAVGGSLSVKYLSSATSTFILRVARAHFRLVWAALAFMDRVPVETVRKSDAKEAGDGMLGRECVFRVVRVSGTVRKAEEEAVKRGRELVSRARREAGNEGASVEDALHRLLGREAGGDGRIEASGAPMTIDEDVDETEKDDDDVLMVDESGSESEEMDEYITADSANGDSDG